MKKSIILSLFLTIGFSCWAMEAPPQPGQESQSKKSFLDSFSRGHKIAAGTAIGIAIAAAVSYGAYKVLGFVQRRYLRSVAKKFNIAFDQLSQGKKDLLALALLARGAKRLGKVGYMNKFRQAIASMDQSLFDSDYGRLLQDVFGSDLKAQLVGG